MEARNLDLVQVGREVKVKKRELANLKEEVEDKENAFRSRDYMFRLFLSQYNHHQVSD